MKLKKKKKGHYIILENDEEVGYVYEGYVGRLGYSHYRWRGEYKGKNILRSIIGIGNYDKLKNKVFSKPKRQTKDKSVKQKSKTSGEIY